MSQPIAPPLPAEAIRVLLVEGDPGDAERVQSGLRTVAQPPFEVSRVESLEAIPGEVERGGFDVVLLGLSQPDPVGLATVEAACRRLGSVPFIVLSVQDDEDFAHTALKAGAQDHLVKSETDTRTLARAIRYAISRITVRREVELEFERARQQAEENARALAESERHARALIRALPDTLFRLDADGTFLDCAVSDEALLLMPREAFIGQSLQTLFPSEYAERGLASIREALASGEIAWYEYSTHALGHPGHFEARVVPLAEREVLMIVRDVSQRHALEAEQAAARRFREMLLASLGEGVFGIDTEGRYTFLNPMACRLLGFTDEAQALGLGSHATSHHTRPDGTHFPEQECPIYGVLQTGEPMEAWEDTFWSHDGRAFPVLVYAAPMYGDEGGVAGAVVSFQDISAQVEARIERDRIQDIIEASPDFVGMADVEGNVLYQNPALTGLIGPPDQLVYREAHPDWAARKLAEEAIPTAAREGVWQGDTALIAPGGRHLPVSQIVVAHTGRNGQVERFSTIMRDMSRQQELEEQLRTEKELSDAILRNLPGAFYMIDAEGRFRRWNERMETVTGYTGDALAEVSPVDLFPESEQELIKARVQHVFEEGSADVEAHLCHRDGSCRAYYFTGYRVELEGQFYLIGVGLDISDLEELKQELVRSNAELEQFAYAVSHDLKEPLRIISSYLSLLVRRLEGGLGDREQRYIDAVIGGAERMGGMIQGLLEYSRINRTGEPMGSVMLGKAVAEARANLEAAEAESGARITVGPLPVVTGNSGQLARLFQNLLGNAIKYGPPEGPPEVHVAAEQVNGQWRISVRDNGIGIEMEQAERVFQVFQRLHGREEYEGTGIGMALAQRIVERHGGTIGVESEGAGQGSTFWFTLPAEKYAE